MGIIGGIASACLTIRQHLVRLRVCTLRARRPNLLIKFPALKKALPAIEESIFAGVPINVTLLFSREHYSQRLRLSCAGSSDVSMRTSTQHRAP